MPFSGSTISVSPTTTAAVTILPAPCYAIVLRTPTANTDDIFVSLGRISSTTGDIRIRPGETFSLDISTALMLNQALGSEVELQDFMERISYISNSGTQTLYIDAFAL